MRNGNEWRWCIAGNVKEEKLETPDGFRRRSLSLKKKVFIAKDYDPASGEVTVARLNIKGRSATIARMPVKQITNIRLIKTRNAWSLVMMSDQEEDGLWWGSSVADMNDAEAYRDLLRKDSRLRETKAEETKP